MLFVHRYVIHHLYIVTLQLYTDISVVGLILNAPVVYKSPGKVVGFVCSLHSVLPLHDDGDGGCDAPTLIAVSVVLLPDDAVVDEVSTPRITNDFISNH